MSTPTDPTLLSTTTQAAVADIPGAIDLKFLNIPDASKSYRLGSNTPNTVQMGIKKDGTWCLVGGYHFSGYENGFPIGGVEYREIPFLPAGSFEEIEPTVTSSSKPTSES